MASQVAQLVKNPPAMQEIWVRSLGWEDPLEKVTYSSILAWRIPWSVWSMQSQRFRHDWATFAFTKNMWWGFWGRLYDHLKSVVLKLTLSKATQMCDFLLQYLTPHMKTDGLVQPMMNFFSRWTDKGAVEDVWESVLIVMGNGICVSWIEGHSRDRI